MLPHLQNHSTTGTWVSLALAGEQDPHSVDAIFKTFLWQGPWEGLSTLVILWCVVRMARLKSPLSLLRGYVLIALPALIAGVVACFKLNALFGLLIDPPSGIGADVSQLVAESRFTLITGMIASGLYLLLATIRSRKIPAQL